MLSFTSLTVLCCISLSLPCHCFRLLIGHLTYFFILSYFIPFYFPHSIPIPTQIEKPPSLSHPILSDTVLSYPIFSYLSLSYYTLPHLILSHLSLFFSITSNPILHLPIFSYLLLSYPISPYPFP